MTAKRIELGDCNYCHASFNTTLTRNLLENKGVWCSVCNEMFKSNNKEYLAECYEVRKSKKLFDRLLTNVFTCRICNIQKTITEDAIRAVDRSYGYVNCCKACYKSNKTTGGLTQEELKQYHREMTAKHHRMTNGRAVREYSRRSSAAIDDAYVIANLRGRLRAKGVKLSEIPKELIHELIQAKRLTISLKRSLNLTQYKGLQNA